MKELEKRIEELKAYAIKEGKASNNKHIKDYEYGKYMAYNNVLLILSDLEG